MDPKVALGEYKKRVDVELEKYFERKVEEYKDVSEFVEMFIKDLAEFTLRGGKRLRPALLYYSYKLCGGDEKKEDEVVKLSIFIELLQSFMLIHDDIMDRALLRRGKTTMHKIYENFSKRKGFKDDEHFGLSMAILSGDLANQLAFEIIAESKFPEDKKNKLVELTVKEIAKTSFGQIHDILLNYNYPANYNENDVLQVHLYKTATYTYELPLFAGAILSGASRQVLNALESFARFGGIAFQIQDDFLGMFGRSGETGKEVKSDIMEGKKTLLVTESYKKANSEQKLLLDRYLGKKDITEAEAEIVREIVRSTGSLEYSKKVCEDYVRKAKESLNYFAGKKEDAYHFLLGIADYLIIRKL